MTNDLRRELRLCVLIATILLGYGTVVATYASEHGQLALLRLGKINGIMATIWITALTFAFCAYATDLIFRRRPAHPLRTMLAELHEQLRRPDLMLARGSIVVGWLGLMILFTPFKIMIGHVKGFPFDATLQQFERWILGGHDAWQLTHVLFGSPLATFGLQLVYNMWFALMWVSIIYFMLRPEQARLRARYILAFILCWILVGSLAAHYLASAGPCYYERALGDAHFRPLMDRLQAIDAELGSIWPGLGVSALQMQNMLWNAFAADRELFGGGISAMPSMHMSVAVLMACAGWQCGRRAGWLLTLFAALIWIGSVHLGWHYALDGAVALGLTLGIWKLSGWLVDAYVLREAPAAAWRPALAE